MFQYPLETVSINLLLWHTLDFSEELLCLYSLFKELVMDFIIEY